MTYLHQWSPCRSDDIQPLRGVSLPLCGLCNCLSRLTLKQKRAQPGTAEQQAQIAFSSLQELNSGALVLLLLVTLQRDSLRESRSFIAAGNALSSRVSRMTIDTQMTLALLQKLLMALRANDADGRSVGVLIHNEAEKILIPLGFS